MSEDTERMKRRLEFLKKERATKVEEMKSEEKLAKLGAISGILGAEECFANNNIYIRCKTLLLRFVD